MDYLQQAFDLALRRYNSRDMQQQALGMQQLAELQGLRDQQAGQALATEDRQRILQRQDANDNRAVLAEVLQSYAQPGDNPAAIVAQTRQVKAGNPLPTVAQFGSPRINPALLDLTPPEKPADTATTSMPAPEQMQDNRSAMEAMIRGNGVTQTPMDLVTRVPRLPEAPMDKSLLPQKFELPAGGAFGVFDPRTGEGKILDKNPARPNPVPRERKQEWEAANETAAAAIREWRGLPADAKVSAMDLARWRNAEKLAANGMFDMADEESMTKLLGPRSVPATPDPAAEKPFKTGAGKPLDEATAKALLQEVGNDKAKARALAKQRGYAF